MVFHFAVPNAKMVSDAKNDGLSLTDTEDGGLHEVPSGLVLAPGTVHYCAVGPFPWRADIMCRLCGAYSAISCAVYVSGRTETTGKGGLP